MLFKPWGRAGLAIAVAGLSLLAAPAAGAQNARTAEHERLYGPTDSRVAAGPELFAALERIWGSDSPRAWTEAKVEALGQFIIQDGEVDAAECDLIAEMTYPFVRVFVVYPDSQVDPFAGAYLTAATTTNDLLRTPLLSLLSAGDLSWKPEDRTGSLRSLFQAALQSPLGAMLAKTLIRQEVARLAADSTVENRYGPLRGFIQEAMGVLNTFEGADNSALRAVLHEAVEQGVEGAPVEQPRFLYNWIRPSPA